MSKVLVETLRKNGRRKEGRKEREDGHRWRYSAKQYFYKIIKKVYK
jgi:hypothetical protein